MNRDRIKEIGLGILMGAGWVLITAWLFYDFEPVSILLLPFNLLYIINIWKRGREARIREMDIRFRDALSFFRNALDAGYSPEHSLQEAAKGLEGLYGKNAAITKEFDRMAGKISTGATMEEAFLEMAERTGVQRIRDFSDMFRILKRTGGNLNKVIKSTITNLTDSINLKRDLNVVIAAKKGEFNIMSCVPYGILMYLKVMAPEMSAPLYHSTFGILFMTGMLICCGGCYLMGRKVIERTLKL